MLSTERSEGDERYGTLCAAWNSTDVIPDRLRNTAGTYGKLAAKSCRKFGYDEGDRLDGYEYSRSR